MEETEYGKISLCKACGKPLPTIGSHHCDPSYKELVDALQRIADETSGGNYSDELKHAIATQEALEFILDHEC